MSAAAAVWAEVERNRSQPGFCVLQFNEASEHCPFQRETLYSPGWVCKFLKSKEQFQPFKFTFNYQWVRRKMLPSKLKSNESLPRLWSWSTLTCAHTLWRVHTHFLGTLTLLCAHSSSHSHSYMYSSLCSLGFLCAFILLCTHSCLCRNTGLCTLWFVHSLHLLCTQTHSGLCTHLFHEVKCCQGTPQEQVFSPGLLREVLWHRGQESNFSFAMSVFRREISGTIFPHKLCPIKKKHDRILFIAQAGILKETFSRFLCVQHTLSLWWCQRSLSLYSSRMTSLVSCLHIRHGTAGWRKKKGRGSRRGKNVRCWNRKCKQENSQYNLS